MSNIFKSLEAILKSGCTGLSEENADHMIEHFRSCEEDAEKFRSREISLEVKLDRSSVDATFTEMEALRTNLQESIFNHMKANGFSIPPEGSEWIKVDRVNELEHREGVIVTDGRTWGIASYNAYRGKAGTPFPVVYDVCEWDIMSDITHFRRMSAVSLPDGSRMMEPQPVVLPAGTLKAPCHQHDLHFHQMAGMRLIEEVKVNKEPVSVYKARCPECGVNHFVKVRK